MLAFEPFAAARKRRTQKKIKLKNKKRCCSGSLMAMPDGRSSRYRLFSSAAFSHSDDPGITESNYKVN